jgi:hypothetical protein
MCEPDERKLKKVATDLWFAVQRMGRRGDGPPSALPEPPPNVDPDGHDLRESGVPRPPAPASGSSMAAAIEPPEDSSG